MEHDREQYLAGEDVAEETKGEGNDLADFGDELQEPHHHPDTIGLAKRADEELATILHDAKRRDTSKLDRDHRDERESQREVEVSGGTAQKGNNSGMARLVGVSYPDRPQARQKSDPVGNQHKQKDGRDHGEKLTGLFLVLGDTLHQTKQCFKDNFQHVLDAPRYEGGMAGHSSDEINEKRAHDDTDQQCVGHGEGADTEQFFRRDRYFHNEIQTKKGASKRL